LQLPAHLVAHRFAARFGLHVGHGNGEAHGQRRPFRLDRLPRLVMGRQDHVSPLLRTGKHERGKFLRRGVQRLGRLLKEHGIAAACHPQQGRHARNVHLVNRANRVDEVAQVLGDFLRIPAEFDGRIHVLPATLADEPARRGEMVISHHRLEAVCQAGLGTCGGNGPGRRWRNGRLPAPPAPTPRKSGSC
jgi:hypothetical protein